MADFWVTEAMNGFGMTVQVTEELCSKRSEFQKIDVYQTSKLGRMLLLDGIIQLTEFDEFAYHEMLAHIPLFAHENPKRLLVVGGGDGGVLREAGKHPELEVMDICEIDAEVIETAKKFFPNVSCGYDDPRVAVHIADGSEFIKDRPGYYDVIIVDSTDPGGPGAPLFGEQFYRDMKKALRPGGVIATQAESPYLLPDIVQRLYKVSEQVVPVGRLCVDPRADLSDRNHRRLRGRRPRRHRVAGAPGSAGVGREAQVLQLEDSRGRVRESVFRETALRLICADGVFGQGRMRRSHPAGGGSVPGVPPALSVPLRCRTALEFVGNKRNFRLMRSSNVSSIGRLLRGSCKRVSRLISLLFARFRLFQQPRDIREPHREGRNEGDQQQREKHCAEERQHRAGYRGDGSLADAAAEEQAGTDRRRA